jgi:hypothetical protein
MQMFSVLLFMMADTSVATQPPPVPEKMICKREQETGSLARFRKICRTESKWRLVSEQAQDEARNMQDRGLINSCAAPPC